MSGDLSPVVSRLTEALRRLRPDVRVTGWNALQGGHSGVTLLVELDGPDIPAQAVLKAGAPGRPAMGRHDVIRQARAMAAVAAAPPVRVPQILLTDEGDPSIFLMSFAAGEAIEPVLEGHGAMDPCLVEARARDCARMMRALHALPIATTPLRHEPVTMLESELQRWAKTMSVVDQTLVPGAADLRDLLRNRLPAELPAALVHGDLRLGNVLYDGTTASGIIDWEIWALTDPRVDLGWFLISCDVQDWPVIGTPAPGMPDTAALLAEYAGGGEVPDAGWFIAFARFKMAAIMAHNLRRHREGRHHDPFQEKLPPMIASLVQRGLAELV